MKSFRSVVVLKRPRDALWSTMRDHLAELAVRIEDIEKIEQQQRFIARDGVIHIANEWHLRQQVPPGIRPILKTTELRWIDRNEWDEMAHICSWAIEPNFLTDYIECSGRTSFESAMGGQGARVTCEGSLNLKPGLFGSSMGSIERLVSGFVESIVTTVIPRNLRSVVEAAAEFKIQ